MYLRLSSVYQARWVHKVRLAVTGSQEPLEKRAMLPRSSWYRLRLPLHLPIKPISIQLKEITMSVGTILLIVLVLMLIGAFPSWPHSRSWGYGPSGGLGLIVVIIIILLLMGKI
jgi:Protein of unknown function (DUF3309)